VSVLGLIAKSKEFGDVCLISTGHEPQKTKQDFYFYNPRTDCWEEWSEELRAFKI